MCMVGGRLFSWEFARTSITSRGFLYSQEEETKYNDMCLLLEIWNATLSHTLIERHEQNSVSCYFLTDLNELVWFAVYFYLVYFYLVPIRPISVCKKILAWESCQKVDRIIFMILFCGQILDTFGTPVLKVLWLSRQKYV